MNRRDILKLGGLGVLVSTASSCAHVIGLLDSYVEQKVDKRLEERFDELTEQREEQKKEELRRHIEGIKKNIVTLNTYLMLMIEKENITPIIDFEIIKGEGLVVGDYIFTVNHLWKINLERECLYQG